MLGTLIIGQLSASKFRDTPACDARGRRRSWGAVAAIEVNSRPGARSPSPTINVNMTPLVRNHNSLTVGETPGAFPQKAFVGEEVIMAPKNLTSTEASQLSPEIHLIDVHVLPT